MNKCITHSYITGAYRKINAITITKLIINKIAQIIRNILNQKRFGYLIYNHF